MRNLAKSHHGHTFKIKVDGENYNFTQSHVTGKDILQIAEKEPICCFQLFLKIHGNEQKQILPDDVIDLASPGREHFTTVKIIEKTIEVDGDSYTTTADVLTPNEILELASISVSDHYLSQIVNGEKISYKDKPNIEIVICPEMRFVSIFIGTTPVA